MILLAPMLMILLLQNPMEQAIARFNDVLISNHLRMPPALPVAMREMYSVEDVEYITRQIVEMRASEIRESI